MTADDENFLLLNAYRDGELSPGEALEMDRKLAADPVLRAMAERLGTLSGALHHALATPPASEALRSRIVQKLGFVETAPRRPSRPSWRSLAAVLLIGLLGGGVIGSGATYIGLAPVREATTDAILAGHLRSLIAPEPFDIASSDRHVVKPWFNGRTTIAPQTPDFAAQGFPLAGGRIDIVGGQPVPTLVYRHDQHVISVTIVPRTTDVATVEERRNGSTIEHWNADDLTYWAVSDLDVRELQDFVALFRTEVAHQG